VVGGKPSGVTVSSPGGFGLSLLESPSDLNRTLIIDAGRDITDLIGI
jgi:hypothetical protein